MAEHPKEVHEITALAKALAVNLGNITDARAESIFISGGVAKKCADTLRDRCGRRGMLCLAHGAGTKVYP